MKSGRAVLIVAIVSAAILAGATFGLMRRGISEAIPVAQGDRIQLINRAVVVVPDAFRGQLVTTRPISRWLLPDDESLQTLDVWTDPPGKSHPFICVRVLTPQAEPALVSELERDGTLTHGEFAMSEGLIGDVWASRGARPTPYVHLIVRPEGVEPMHICSAGGVVSEAIARGDSDTELAGVVIALLDLRLE